MSSAFAQQTQTIKAMMQSRQPLFAPFVRQLIVQQLTHGGFDGTLAGISACRHSRLQHHEIAPLDVAGRNEIVDRDAGIEIEPQARRVFAAAVGLLELHDNGAPRRHHAAVARKYLVWQVGRGGEHVHGHIRLGVRVEHLAVLGSCDGKIEVQSDALRALRHGVARPPREMIDGSDQHVAQGAVFAVDAPTVEPWSTSAFEASPQMHHEFPLIMPLTGRN